MISNIAVGLKTVYSIIDLRHIVKSQCFQHFTSVPHLLTYQKISRKIIIETSLEHLMFICKCQAILKKVWPCIQFDENSWKLDVNIRLLGVLFFENINQLHKDQDTVFESPLILCSASYPLYSYVLTCSKLYSPGTFSNFKTAMLPQMLKGWAGLIANCAFSYSLSRVSVGVTFLWRHLCYMKHQ